MKKGPFIAVAMAGIVLLSGCNGNNGFTRENIGMATGGALGGYVGSQIGSGSGRLAATAVGAVAGALIGGAVGRTMDEQDQWRSAQALESSRSNHTTRWHNPDSGVDYAVTPTRTYETANGPCRDFTSEAVIDGRRQTVYGSACRQPNGSWRTIN